jgi:folate-binding Fe-S cluster repair protein YgfZ
LSNDINKIVDEQWQLNAYCQHQGRIIALMWVQKQNDDFYLDFGPMA